MVLLALLDAWLLDQFIPSLEETVAILHLRYCWINRISGLTSVFREQICTLSFPLVFFLHIVNLLIGATIGLFFCIAVLYEVEMFRLGKA
ncbi:hypothetical protein VNO80_02630 [Phaseolus coccineus]|uniref:Uncharacterized protein n=1 Tax=Phaseolus coccineus TaxID=3886 RepID=A0AAN9RMJ4_PHACN